MDGAQDMGGVDGFGPVVPEPNEPMFHSEWERRAFAVTLAMARPGGWNIDMSRFAREDRPRPDYLSKTYYELWLVGLERLMAERGLVAREEIDAGRALHPARSVEVLHADGVDAMLKRGAPTERATSQPARFAVGDRVRAREMSPPTHTRLPRYVRGHMGTIERAHGAHVFADSHAHGLGEQSQWLYTVTFAGRELWGDDTDPTLAVSVDAWDSYLGAGLMALDTSLASVLPDLPVDDDGPVFREPWEAQAFAMTLTLHQRGVFTWPEWANALAQQIKRAQAAGDPDRGDTYYRHWLATLERLVAEKGVASADVLSRTREAWDHAADRTPHGQPIELRPGDFHG